MILNQQRNSRPEYGKKELAYTPYKDGLIGADSMQRIVEKTALDFIYMYLPRLV